MLTTKEAIERRRSIRRYRSDPVPEEHILAMVEAARLAPSGSNAQPWRFKVVREGTTREKLAAAAYGQKFIARAPVVIACCADVEEYLNGTVSGARYLGEAGAIEENMVNLLVGKAGELRADRGQIGPKVAANVAIAVEHMVLRALDFELGTCWVRAFEEPRVREILKLGENYYVVALLPVGYPAEAPAARKRLSVEEILLD